MARRHRATWHRGASTRRTPGPAARPPEEPEPEPRKENNTSRRHIAGTIPIHSAFLPPPYSGCCGDPARPHHPPPPPPPPPFAPSPYGARARRPRALRASDSVDASARYRKPPRPAFDSSARPRNPRVLPQQVDGLPSHEPLSPPHPFSSCRIRIRDGRRAGPRSVVRSRS